MLNTVPQHRTGRVKCTVHFKSRQEGSLTADLYRDVINQLLLLATRLLRGGGRGYHTYRLARWGILKER